MKTKVYQVENLWPVAVAINLARHKLDSRGVPLRQAEIEPDLPATFHPTDMGMRKEYRLRQGQLQIVDRGHSIHLEARGRPGSTVRLKDFEVRAPDLQAKLRAGALRIKRVPASS